MRWPITKAILIGIVIVAVIAFGFALIWGPELSADKSASLRAVIGVLVNVVAVLNNGGQRRNDERWPEPAKGDPEP
jgi:hypothetical protein